MNRITRRLLPITIIAALTLGGFVTTALACGPPSVENLVQWTVESHLAAVKNGDAKTLKQVWLPTATVTGVSKTGARNVSKIKRAIRRWTKTPDKAMSFKLGKITVSGDTARVALTLTWHGQKYQEELTVARQSGYLWMLADKTHAAVGKPTPTKKRTTRRTAY